MGHFDSFSFHGMLFREVVVGDGVVVQVGYFFHEVFRIIIKVGVF